MIKELVEKITKANVAYRLGKPIMSDGEYDILVDELWEIDPHNPILSKVDFLLGTSQEKGSSLLIWLQ
jgi:NAD-dependent DNA ligase